MFRLLTLALLSVLSVWLGAAPALLAAPRNPDAVAVYECSFGHDHDQNYDRWPDGWRRDVSDEFPHYVEVAIADDDTVSDHYALGIQLDGASARFESPPIPILHKFGYEFRFALKAEGLTSSRVQLYIDLYNEADQRIQTIRSARYGNTEGWVEEVVDTFRAHHREVHHARIRCEAVRGRRGDLQGRVWIDDLWLARLPSIVVTTNSPLNVYTDASNVEVTCALSGIREQNPTIRFQLLDATRYDFAQAQGEDKRLQARLISQDDRSAYDIVGKKDDLPAGYEGTETWRPPITASGFYKIRVQMLSTSNQEGLTDEQRLLYKEDISLVVLPPLLPKPQRGEFGWSMPVARWPLSRKEVSDLVQQTGIHWLKTPAWFAADNPEEGEAIVQFAERLAASEIEVVGLIEDPTAQRDDDVALHEATSIASLMLADRSVWQPFYEHVMTRLSMRIRWWQLGSDGDYSLKDYPELGTKMTEIRQGLFRFGQDARLGLGWRWPTKTEVEENTSPLVEAEPSWEFEQFVGKTSPTATGFDAAMLRTPRSSALRWVNIQLPKQYLAEDTDTMSQRELRARHEGRIREFVQQILVAKRNAADGIFVSDIFRGADGMMQLDGTPGELFLPWRTAATLLGGARFLGSIQMPHDSENYIFAREDGELVMVLWNDQPITEQLYLGESLEQIDVWGNRLAPHKIQTEHVVAVDRLPTFIVGLNGPVARWRMAANLAEDHVPSVFSREHKNAMSLTNHFRQGAGGTARIVVLNNTDDSLAPAAAGDKQWRILPDEVNFRLGPGERVDLPFGIVLDEATYGPQPIRIDFHVEADRVYDFSVWRKMYVGLDDIQIAITTHLDAEGRLIVRQQMQNDSDKLADFKCLLYAPPRPRKRSQVFLLGPEGDTKEYVYENGQELVGRELKLRAEEIDGQRILIHRFTAER